MKEIKAFVRNSRAEKVIHGLMAIGVKAMSVTDVQGVGALADSARGRLLVDYEKLSIDYASPYCRVYKIEVVCRSKDANLIVSTIQKLAHTGEGGDGVIFVSPIERAVKIRSDEEGQFFLDSADKNSRDEK